MNLKLMFCALLGLFQVMSASGWASGPDSDQATVIAKIKKLGGKVTVDEKSPDKPAVAVSLATCKNADAALELIEGLKHLKSLTLCNAKVSDAAMGHLRSQSDLESLILRGTHVGDAGLKHLHKLTAVKDLNLAYTEVTDAGLGYLSGMTKLQVLFLGKTKVGDQGLKHLSKLTNLEQLHLGETRVSDAGLGNLRGLTRLRWLYVKGSQVTSEGITSLQQSLPNCEKEAPKKLAVDLGGGVKMELVLIPAGEFMMGSTEAEDAPDPLPNEKIRRDDEGPVHRVRITKPYYLGAYELTQAQWSKVMGTTPADLIWGNPGEDRGPNKPMVWVTWYDAVAFCNRLSEREHRKPYYRISDIKRRRDKPFVIAKSVAPGSEEYKRIKQWHDTSPSIVDATVTVLGDDGYRLPTEAQWEYTCRAGTTTPYAFGKTLRDSDANFDSEKCKDVDRIDRTLGDSTTCTEM